MPSQLEQAALRFRSELGRNERQAATEMVRTYAASWQRVRHQLAQVQQRIQVAEAMGLTEDVFRVRLPGGPALRRASGTYSPSWRWQEQRLESLQRQIEAELRTYMQYAAEITEASQLQATQAAMQHSQQLVRYGAQAAGTPQIAGMFDRLPTQAVQDLVGFASDGSPLRELFDALGVEVGRGAREALSTAIATGLNSRQTANMLRSQFGMGLTRSLTIARTETLRAYRETTRRNYEQNSDILDGWIWVSAHDSRSCISCWAMHGTRHAVTDTLDDHPNGRCVMVPIVNGHNIKVTPGEELFNQLSEDKQRAIMGQAAHRAYRAGAVRFAQFVGRKDDQRWGTMRYARSLKEILGKDEAKKWSKAVQNKEQQSSAAEVKPAQTAEMARQRLTKIADGYEQKLSANDEKVLVITDEIEILNGQMRSLYDQIPANGQSVLWEQYHAKQREREEKCQALESVLDERRELHRARGVDMREVLVVDDPVSVTAGTTSRKPPPTWKEGADEFSRLVSKRTAQDSVVSFRSTRSQRSYYLSGEVYMSSSAGVRVVAHELGHWLEAHNPALHQAVLDFYDKRTTGESLVWLGSGYAKHEKARFDKFIRPYMGKDYGRTATEIVSMGIEYFYADPLVLAKQDPEYFDFIYNLLRGIW